MWIKGRNVSCTRRITALKTRDFWWWCNRFVTVLSTRNRSFRHSRRFHVAVKSAAEILVNGWDSPQIFNTRIAPHRALCDSRNRNRPTALPQIARMVLRDAPRIADAAKSVSRITKVNWSTNWLSIYSCERRWAACAPSIRARNPVVS